MSADLDFNILTNSRYDGKWLKIDLQDALKRQQLAHSWNELIKDGEIYGDFSDTLMNGVGVAARKGHSGHYYCGLRVLSCACCDGICGPQRGCNCGPCQQLDQEEPNRTPTHKPQASAPILDRWEWANSQSVEELESCVHSLAYEQRQICESVAGSTLSVCRLRQRLAVTYRYFLALGRHTPSTTTGVVDPTVKADTIKQATRSTITTKKNLSKLGSENASLGLARVGTRAALNFSFAFLRRAWRSGEDADLCSELLQESLAAMQSLPPATLFDDSTVSPVWMEVVDRSAKFLKQVVLGEDNNGVTSQVPQADQHYALCLLLELAFQRATLSHLLEAVLLLLHLHSNNSHRMDNRIGLRNSKTSLDKLTMASFVDLVNEGGKGYKDFNSFLKNN